MGEAMCQTGHCYLLNYALDEEQLRYFSLENYIIYLDLEEVEQVACRLFQVHIQLPNCLNSNYQDDNG